jgi:MFS family permease
MGSHGTASTASSLVYTSRSPITDEGPSRGRGFRTFRALRHRNYRLFFLGQSMSLVGTWVQFTAMMWLANQLTGTSRWPALVGAMQLVPGFLFGAWGGVLADRVPKRALVFCTQSVMLVLALGLTALVASGVATVWHLLVIAGLIGIVNAVDLPTRLAFLIEMVGKEDLVNAVALNSLMFNVARTAGPAACAWLLPHWGAEACFFLNALSYGAVLVALARMQVTPPVACPKRLGGWSAALAGFRYVTGHPSLRLLLPLTGAVALFGWPILALLPALARRHLEAGGSAYSSMLSAIGLGALSAALLVASFGSLHRRRFFLAAGVLVASSALVALSLAPTVPAAVCCCGFLGCGLILFFATSQATFQLSAGDHNRGRVMSIYSIVLSGTNPLGNLLAGPAADHLGEPIILRIQGIAMLTVAALVLGLRWLRPENREQEDLMGQPIPGPD